MSKDFIFKLKRNDGTFSVFALQFNDYMQVKLTVVKGINPQYNEVLTVLFTHTDVIERIKTNQMGRLNPSRVVSHVGMSSAKDLWIEYVWNLQNHHPESDFNFIPSVKQSKKFHISMHDKVETFELYIMDLIDIAIELRIISVTENGIKYGDKWIPYLNVTEVAPINYDTFIKAEDKNNVYRMLDNFNLNETNGEIVYYIPEIGTLKEYEVYLSYDGVTQLCSYKTSIDEYYLALNNGVTENTTNWLLSKVSLNLLTDIKSGNISVYMGFKVTGCDFMYEVSQSVDTMSLKNKIPRNEVKEDVLPQKDLFLNCTNSVTNDFISECDQKVASMILLDEIEIKRLNDIDSETSNEILKGNTINYNVIRRINECLECVNSNTISTDEDIEFLNGIKDEIGKSYSELIESIVASHYEIESETNNIISNIIESERMESEYMGNMYGEISSETSNEIGCDIQDDIQADEICYNTQGMLPQVVLQCPNCGSNNTVVVSWQKDFTCVKCGVSHEIYENNGEIKVLNITDETKE